MWPLTQCRKIICSVLQWFWNEITRIVIPFVIPLNSFFFFCVPHSLFMFLFSKKKKRTANYQFKFIKSNWYDGMVTVCLRSTHLLWTPMDRWKERKNKYFWFGCGPIHYTHTHIGQLTFIVIAFDARISSKFGIVGRHIEHHARLYDIERIRIE